MPTDFEIRPATDAVSPPDFAEFASIARLSREMVVTEKIDGTNAQVTITEDGRIFAGSRSRWITPEADNFGFARWVRDHRDELLTLGPGSHYGEWWGSGIQRGYGLMKGEKRWSLFNTGRWAQHDSGASGLRNDKMAYAPACCHVVPVIYEGVFDTVKVDEILVSLAAMGSHAAPGFMQPEGIVVWHEKARVLFKKTLNGDGHKSA